MCGRVLFPLGKYVGVGEMHCMVGVCLTLNFTCLFLAALGLCCCSRAFSGCRDQGLLFVAVRLLIVVASPVAEHRL